MAGGGGSEPNLTPFIDLFSVLICFLLMTAAWIQLEAMPTNIEKAPQNQASQDETVPPPTPPKDEKKVSLIVMLGVEKVILKENEKEFAVNHLNGEFDKEQLQEVLHKWRNQFPEKKDIILNTESNVTYGNLIKMYDLLISSDWADVGINPN